ncbi:hypothetical protein JHK82_012520 [Glycine max]|nr:hypothetical protein JHK85_012875 [Glycine max]KAG5057543.1 hypothetical protein JHK86_012539 [Glycine max]KAG5154551.1 hypothetical protein JHK82_012520 [Glycine max]
MWMPSTASRRRKAVQTLQRCLLGPRERRLTDGDRLHLRRLGVAELELERCFNIAEEEEAPQPWSILLHQRLLLFRGNPSLESYGHAKNVICCVVKKVQADTLVMGLWIL